MGKIVLLDDLTINKIAAGEVIERPASVVKEVVENSIDAGADNISIEIKNGGISYIRITDNGKGIAADDLEIAFERHATSKIRKADDLETVKSMGFRGEALASIAAIARVELVTKTEDSDIGHKIVVEGGRVLMKEETGCPKGTSITIENLFYNTPVRYKFLKKDFTESGYIEDTITRIALINPNIAIKFVNSGKTILQTSGNGNLKDIVYSVYGKDVAENITNVDYYFEDMAVKGVIGKPSIARSNRTNQLFFVNKRFVKDRTLTSAAEQGFKGMLPVGKFGFLILNIEIDPHKLDVNVHPAKLEVRFQEENKIFKLVYHAIKESLLKVDTIDNSVNYSVENLQDNSYNEEIKRIENKVFDNLEENEEHENKGFGGFFKNILNSSKNEFANNEENLVEQLYNDKMQYEQEMVLNEIRNASNKENNNHINNDIKNNIQFNNNDNFNMNSEDKLKSNDYLNTFTDKKLNNDYDNNNYDNIIIKEDGGIELKSFEKKNVNYNNLGNYGIDNDDFKNNSNLERLVKELDENLEKLNLKQTTLETLREKNDENGNANNNINSAKLEDTIEIKTLNEDIGNEVKQEKIEVQNELKSLVEQEKNDAIIEQDSNSLNQSSKHQEKNNDNSKSDDKFEEMYAKMFGTNITNRNKVEEKNDKVYQVKQEDFRTVENVSLFANNSFYNRPVYKYIGIVFGTYIVIEYEKEMYVVDQRAAYERILYEKVKNNYYSTNDKDSQLMLLPDIINLTDRQIGIVKDNIDIFEKAGFVLEEFGDKTIKLSGVPNICINLDTKKLFLDILDEINTVARTARQEVEEKFIATIACKAAEKVEMALTVQEVDSLMQQLLKLPSPFISPNGTPTAIRMSKIDIEKKFSRR